MQINPWAATKILPIFHGNEHIQPSEKIKELTNPSNDEGIYRAPDIESFEIPFIQHLPWRLH